MEWIQDVGAMYLAKKGLSVSEYLESLTSPKVPIDELGLLILARMYHGHVAVIMFDWCWTTDLVPTTCEYIFAYVGGVKFLATCSSVVGQNISYRDFLKSVGVSQKGQKKALDLSVQSDEKSENKENSNENKAEKRKKSTSTRKHSSKRRHSSRTVTLPLPFSFCSRTRSGRTSGCTSRTSK